jgi:multiple antibiotic resistance protein
MDIEQLVNLFVTFFVVIDPIGIAPMFGALTRGSSDAYARRMAVKGVTIAFVILAVFASIGDWLLGALGITVSAFKIAGGLLLFFVALDMVFAGHSGARSTLREEEEARHKPDISVFPVAFPWLAGPGALATILLVVGEARVRPLLFFGMLGVLAVVLAMALAALWFAPRLMRLLGETGASVIDRLLGVILAALAAQYVVDGIKGSFAV